MNKKIKMVLVAVVFLGAVYACQTRHKCATYIGSDATPVQDEAVYYNQNVQAPTPTYSNKRKISATTTTSGSYNNGYAVEYDKETVGEWDIKTDEEVAPTDFNTESYNTIHENQYLSSKENPLSTFSIDVDGASYSNTRRYIKSGVLPQKDVVRIEEFINYFSYNYDQPKDQHPFAINTETVDCPWNKDHKLVMIGLQGKRYNFESLP